MANRNAGGNASKSLDQHKLDGTYRKDRHEAIRNPEPTPGRPEPQSELSNIEQAAWDWLVWALEDQGSLHRVTGAAIYQYCKLFAETEAVAEDQATMRASVKILEENIREVEKAELVALFQEVGKLRTLVSKSTDQLRSGRVSIKGYLVEFGLTPASRGRVKLPAKKEEVDEFSAFQQKRAM